MGTPDFSVGCLDALIRSKHEVVGVFTREDKPKNRGMAMQMPPVKELAIQHNIPVFQPKSVKTDESYEILKELNADIYVVVAYGRILPKKVLELPQHGCINVHASILPKYRGASPIQAVIVNGEKETGVTIMQMNEGLDTGDILHVKKTPISEDDTGGTLHDRLAVMGADALIEYLDILEKGERVAIPQDDALSNYAPLITKNDGKVSFENPANKIANQIMGYAPWPGTFADLGNTTIKFFGGYVVENTVAHEDFGAIDSVTAEGMVVKCAVGKILIKEIQKSGGKRMTPDSFFRGRPELLKERFN
ncbi:MAG: methionyl-tRNA formyltransferase [Clostridia bacterium]|nr:methionyl-tRNA formyltransferase [Clostridia bacterium]